jgi:hypothetical protein
MWWTCFSCEDCTSTCRHDCTYPFRTRLGGCEPSHARKAPLPVLSPVFKPLRLDDCAAGDISADDANSEILEVALALPLHRYDWWAPPAQPPSPFPSHLPMAGKPLPWVEWDNKAAVDQYTVHFSRKQIDSLWCMAMQVDSGGSSRLEMSKHDALLAHIWSCVVCARGL